MQRLCGHHVVAMNKVTKRDSIRAMAHFVQIVCVSLLNSHGFCKLATGD